jgi:hypothetical protein
VLRVFFLLTGVCPPPPAQQIGNKKENLQKHIRIQLHLIKQKEKQHYIDNAQRPTPYIRFRRKKNGYRTRQRSKKLEVAHRVAEQGEKNGLVIEEVHYLRKAKLFEDAFHIHPGLFIVCF